jgi:glutamate/tyrosine decarboxylase-like PLP-dependent enzyme
VLTEDFASAAHRAADIAASHLSGIRAGPVWQPMADADRAWLRDQPLPDAGRPLDTLLADIAAHVLPYPMGNGHPRFFGWVNSPPAPAGVMVEPIAAAMNPSCAGGEHAAIEVERCVVRWLAGLIGYPHQPGSGLLTSGASLATVGSLAAARHRAAARDGWDVRADGLAGRRPFVLYVSAEGHSCLRKAAELLGLGRRGVRVIPADAGFRMDLAALRAALARDRADGLRPFCVAATAGTVNSGAIDPLDQLADLAAEHDLWLHVDGAYGALGVLDPQIAPAYAGLERADSLVLDPHKWLGVPVDCGCLLVRDPDALRDAFSLVPPYLRDDHASGPGWFSEHGPEQTRPFRALRAWATLAHLGRSGVTDLVVRAVALARTLAGLIDAADDLERLAPAVTSIVAFRYRPPGLADGELDDINRPIPAAVQRRGQAFLTGTRLAGREALRACLIHPDTTVSDLEVLLEEVRAAARSRLASPPGPGSGCPAGPGPA